MKVIVFGTGGREHSLIKALSSSSLVSEVHAVPGSDGISNLALCHNIDPLNFEKLGSLIDRFSFELAVVGPEVYLDQGLVDFLKEKSIPTVGPNQAAARLESSKLFAKKYMIEAGVPTASFAEVSTPEDVLEASKKFTPPYVLKLDGLAAGKGVFICKDLEELQEKSKHLDGKKALLEQYQTGTELSCLVLTNGKDFEILPLMQDHKRLSENDEGPNTGGMGVVGPLQLSEKIIEDLREKVVRPSVLGLERMGLDYKGVLFIGVMITSDGPSVLEYNVRFGDPEAQAIMPLLLGDWGQVFKDLAQGHLKPLKWRPFFSACVVLASPGYPDAPQNGVRIEGDLDFETPSSYFLHAGTQYKDKVWTTRGGRVLNAIGIGSTLQEALKLAYNQASKVNWVGLQMRRDIGKKINPIT